MSEWQDIKTAPMDGTDIILFDGFGVSVGAYDADYSFEDFLTICAEGEGKDEWLEYLQDNPGQGWMTHETISGESVFFEPTHWQPLPAPPKP